MKRRTPTTSPVEPEFFLAFSYLRFSDLVQRLGDSVRRQIALRDDWLARNPNVRLDTSATLHDLGRSAFTGAHRENPDRHALAVFLKLVEAGRVPRGSYLLIENLDRLSREEEVPACHLLTGILLAGVRVVQLAPYEMVLTEKSNGWELMRAVMELSRGYGESAMKSDRVGRAWAEKKRRAGAGETQAPTKAMGDGAKLVTRRLPAWMNWRDGKPALIPARVKVIRRIFLMARNGYGKGAIAKKLNAEGVQPITDGKACGKYWGQSYVSKILYNRSVLGEYQPHTRRGGKRRPEGDPIANYYPRAIKDEQWNATHAAIASRRNKGGRPSKQVNLFSGMLRNAADGSTLQMQNKGKKGAGVTLKSRYALNGVGGSAGASFPLATLEAAVLSLLKEIDPREVLGKETEPDEASALAGELAAVEGEIAKLEADLERDGHSDAMARVLRRQETRKAELVPLLNAARQKAANPLSEAWGEFRSLLDALDAAPDPVDARMRLRGVLRRITESIWLLIAPRRSKRLAAVQIWFAGGACRSYLIEHTPGFANEAVRRPARWEARSLIDISPDASALDLRDRKQAEQLAADLAAVEPNVE